MDADADALLVIGDDNDTIGPAGFPRTIATGQLFNLANDASNRVSPLEQEVLDEYTRLLKNMNQVSRVFKPNCVHGSLNLLTPACDGLLVFDSGLEMQAITAISMAASNCLDHVRFRTIVGSTNEIVVQLNSVLADLSSGPITLEIAESLRLLERKVASVYTLMKASVYSIVLQQGQVEGDTTRLDSLNSGDAEATQIQTTMGMR